MDTDADLKVLQNILVSYNKGLGNLAELVLNASLHGQEEIPVELVLEILQQTRKNVENAYDNALTVLLKGANNG